MKTFNQVTENEKPLASYMQLNESEFTFLNEAERIEVQDIITQIGDKKLSELDEGFLGQILGGVAGYVIGPAIGKVIANALGVEKGILYDMMTSKLVSVALGASIAKYMSGGKK